MVNKSIIFRPLSVVFGAMIIALATAGVLLFGGAAGAVAAGAAFAAVLVATVGRGRLERVALGALAVLITGYMFLGRGFAYVTFGPVYIGEIVLALLVLIFVGRTRTHGMWRSPVLWLYLVFAGWGACLAAADFHTYGMDTIRDSAIWYYGMFMVVCSWLFGSRERLQLFIRWVARVSPWFLLWVPIAYALYYSYASLLPNAPGSDTTILVFKGGDVAVTLAVVLAFLTTCRSRIDPFQQRFPIWTLWIAGVVDFVLIATKNRGGLLSVVAGVALAVMLMPSLRLVQGLAIGAMLIVIAVMGNVQVQEQGRNLSVTQLETNAASIGDSNPNEGGALSGTEGWRLAFWSDIVNDTVYGQHFWTGHGFGLNLADHYGFQPEENGSLRDPHDASMTVLARMGVPGLIMWLTLNLTYAGTMLASCLRARSVGDRFWVAVFTLLLVHWLAATIDSSFDPYLEGPQGAIAFWCSIGIGVAARRVFLESWAERRAQTFHAVARRFVPQPAAAAVLHPLPQSVP